MTDEADPTDIPFARKLWMDGWPNLAGLLGADLLGLAWCAPVVLALLLSLRTIAAVLYPITVGPAMVGLFRYAANLALDRPANAWRDSLGGMRSGFGLGTCWAALLGVAWAANQIALQRAVADGLSPGAMALWGGHLGLCLGLSILATHALGLAALYRQGIREGARNAAVLLLRRPMPGLGLVVLGALGVQACRLWSWGPLIILPALFALLAVNTTLLLVRPYQERGATPRPRPEARAIAARASLLESDCGGTR